MTILVHPCQQDRLRLPVAAKLDTADERHPGASLGRPPPEWISDGQGIAMNPAAQTRHGRRHKRHRRPSGRRHGCDGSDRTASDLEAVQEVVKQQLAAHTICEEGRCPTGAKLLTQPAPPPSLLGGPILHPQLAFCQVREGPGSGSLRCDEAERVAKLTPSSLRLRGAHRLSPRDGPGADTAPACSPETMAAHYGAAIPDRDRGVTPDFWAAIAAKGQV